MQVNVHLYHLSTLVPAYIFLYAYRKKIGEFLDRHAKYNFEHLTDDYESQRPATSDGLRKTYWPALIIVITMFALNLAIAIFDPRFFELETLESFQRRAWPSRP